MWKKDNIILPYNRELAEKRLYSLEKKFTKNKHFKQLYEQQISDYIEKGYAKKLSENELPITLPITNYVPHHGVLSVNKPNKVRVVFDAAAIYHETCLNNNLLPGLDLVSVLCRFRQGEYAVISDIKTMFYQVFVPSPDTDALRFLWRKGTDTEIEDYAMRVNIFGKTDSPCAANWDLKQRPPEDDYQLKRIIEDNFYMDDFLYSMNYKLKLNKLCIRLINVLSSHGFNLTKWMSNHPDVLNDIPKEQLLSQNIKLDFNSEITERALGLLWDVKKLIKLISSPSNIHLKAYPIPNEAFSV